ncbi:MAG: NAD(P)/FAD-dependent oxidoreductase [Lachnospiraceae bacterium]|nr:NAD(P)/FAD-dependent oxidoreductase [Lachnospiraceae bacterium]
MGKRVLIIGGGASGLMAAIMAAGEGAKVTVLERESQVGKKLLVTGNGRCNLSNRNQQLSNYRCEKPEFVARALGVFGQTETQEFFQQLGIYLKDKNGYLYPYSQQATAVADVLRMEAVERGVKLSCNTSIQGIEKKEGRFLVKTPGWTYEGEALLLACGSLAHGGSGDGYVYAKQFGHEVTPVLPALVQLKASRDWPGQLAGIRMDARVSLLVGEELLAEDTGEVQFLSYGISGIPVFQVSRYGARALAQKSQVEVRLHLLPSFSREELEAFLAKRVEGKGTRAVEPWLLGLFPQKLIPVLLKRAGISKGQRARELTRQDLGRLAEEISQFRVPIVGTNGYSQAQICTGGIGLAQVKPETMESSLVSGLYFAGEILDVDGACGGYNLQWAWTSGCLAGRGAARGETARGKEAERI